MSLPPPPAAPLMKKYHSAAEVARKPGPSPGINRFAYVFLSPWPLWCLFGASSRASASPFFFFFFLAANLGLKGAGMAQCSCQGWSSDCWLVAPPQRVRGLWGLWPRPRCPPHGALTEPLPSAGLSGDTPPLSALGRGVLRGDPGGRTCPRPQMGLPLTPLPLLIWPLYPAIT